MKIVSLLLILFKTKVSTCHYSLTSKKKNIQTFSRKLSFRCIFYSWKISFCGDYKKFMVWKHNEFWRKITASRKYIHIYFLTFWWMISYPTWHNFKPRRSRRKRWQNYYHQKRGLCELLINFCGLCFSRKWNIFLFFFWCTVKYKLCVIS